jgi:SAM-dependent methyltransferase
MRSSIARGRCTCNGGASRKGTRTSEEQSTSMRAEVIERLSAPGGGGGLRLASVAETLDGRVIQGSALSPEGGLFPVQEGVLNLLPDGVGALSPAQRSNQLWLVARGYEWPWRLNALSLMSGESLPFEQERVILDEMLGVAGDGLWLDLGASTALYGRWLATRVVAQGGEVIALDFAWPMLRVARDRALTEGHPNLSFVRARAEALPFATGSLDGVVSGGTLNEFGDRVGDALQEVARALKPGGAGLFMHLLTAQSRWGRLFQKAAIAPGGIRFWNRDASSRLFEHAGLRVTGMRATGIVAFTRVVRA